MTPTNKLRFVERTVPMHPIYRTVGPDGKMREGVQTYRVLQQWWEPEYHEFNAGKTGEWRDVPLGGGSMKYRKKPVVIEATQWFKQGDHPHVQMCWFDESGRVRWAPGDSSATNIYGCTKRPAIVTLEGWHEVTPGDWIITGIKGEHYPCKPDIFAATYEPVEEA